MDFGKSFTFMFEDRDWLAKLGIGTLVGLGGLLLCFTVVAPFVAAFILMGYCVDLVRNLIDGRQTPLPHWEDWSGFLNRGFRLWAALFIWALPGLLAIVPLMIGSGLADIKGQAPVGIVLITCSSCLLLLWGLFLTLMTPAIWLRVARTDRFGAAFEFGKLWEFTRANLGSVIVAIVLTWVAGLVVSVVVPLGLLALCIGVLITVPFGSLWSSLVQAHLYGQIGASSVVPAA